MKKSQDKNRRVVVTGLGVVSSLGIGWEEFWKNLIAGKSGIGKVDSFDTSQYDRHYAGEVKNFDPAQFLNARKAKQMGRSSQMAIAASKLALKDAKIHIKDVDKWNIGICIGTTMGEPQVMESLNKKCYPKGKWRADFSSALSYPANTISRNTAQALNLHNRNIVFSNACAAGNYAIGYSFDLIRSGQADFMLAGGVDALSRVAFTGFNRLIAMAPEKCQPFDKNRKGMIVGEGAGILLLESLESAEKRNAVIYAEILGYGLSCDAHHMTSPSTEGIVKAISHALIAAKIKPQDVDYINAHGTGTVENDRAECKAINRVFGDHTPDIPVSAIKSMLGHTMGAASAMGAISCCLSVHDHKIPPTINFEEQDKECNIDCVPNEGRKHDAKLILNNSQAFGGNNACVVLKLHGKQI